LNDTAEHAAPLASFDAFKKIFRDEIAPDLGALERERTSASDRASRAFLYTLPVHLLLGFLWWLGSIPWWGGLGASCWCFGSAARGARPFGSRSSRLGNPASSTAS
jgi:hypothetical protein